MPRFSGPVETSANALVSSIVCEMFRCGCQTGSGFILDAVIGLKIEM